MSEEKNPWQIRFERERKSRKESEALLEQKSLELWKINQDLEKQVEQRTKSLEEALIKAEKADSAKSDFLANMSHEIRTPLNAIIGFSQFLAKSDELSEQNSKYSSIIESSATSLLAIINDILDFSKIESGNFDISKDDCNIYSICNSVVELFSQKTEEKYIELIFKMNENIPSFIYSDELRLRQVLSNLLSNAVKFTNEHGKIEFRVALLKKDEQKVLISFEVEDSGIGIPKDRLETIFKPFTQLEHIANKQYRGTGLGLSISHNILELLDSNLEVDSEIGRGTIFRFELEARISEKQDKKESINREEHNGVFEGKLLLAEDNLANQELMRLVFSEIEIDFDIASNGLEAFEMYKEDSSYSLILMDINMPEVNGVEALFMIRNFEEEYNLKSVPIVALTANAIKGDKERFLSLGMDDYLSKPIELNSLKEITSKYMSGKKELVLENKTDNLKLSKIVNKLGVSENIAELVLKKFKEEIKKDLSQLKSFVEEENSEEIAKKAHYIKNSCLNVCFDEACEILQEMENTNLDKDEIKELFNKVEKLINNSF